MRVPATLRLEAESPADLALSAAILARGGLVAFPTETVYGLGADATNPLAVAGIYNAKGRPAFNPLIAHVASWEQARALGDFDGAAEKLAAAFWPGALTLVVPHRGNICDLARAGLDTIGLRLPGSAVARALISAAGCPVAAPSANRSGHVSPVTAAHVLQDLDGRIDGVLNGGACAVGLESTIIACLDGTVSLLRPGGITIEAAVAVLGQELGGAAAEVIAPGMLASHYAPNATLRLDAQRLRDGETGIDFGGQLRRAAGRHGLLADLSPSSDLAEAAANLFTCLRALDQSGADRAAIAPIPRHGLGAAINDRLNRAAAGRA